MLWLLLVACEPMNEPGAVFAPVVEDAPPADGAPRADVGAAAGGAATGGAATKGQDARFPNEDPLVLSSEQMAGGDISPLTGTGEAMPAASSAAPTEPAPPTPVAVTVSLPEPVGVPPATRWPVRLLTTLPNAQPPRAVIGLPSGEERVVSPGSIIAEEGLIVTLVAPGRVQLARVEAAGDHARIETVELTAMY